MFCQGEEKMDTRIWLFALLLWTPAITTTCLILRRAEPGAAVTRLLAPATSQQPATKQSSEKG